ncbi:MAG TPA: DUF2760 domain-containing protein [Anaeromyxobacter sp.]|nr:DUF2760 domain-containing protein [Anaeromyxobacter sp.]
MAEPAPTPLQRIVLAFYAFFAILFRADVATAVQRVREARRAGRPALGAIPPPEDTAPPRPAAERASPAEAKRPDARPALYLLSVLQREGRLVDFLEEDLASFPDAAVGAAARSVHEGCKRALGELVRIEPVLGEREGAVVTVDRGFDPAAIRLTGSVVGEPPFRGALRHHGWRAKDVKLVPPADGLDPSILAPAEVEL